MAIKARPYGRKPGIAVAKETKSRLLTIWPLKLWGAAAPVAQKGILKKCKKIRTKQGERNNQCHSVMSSEKSPHCEVVGEYVTALLIYTGREARLCLNMLVVNRQQDEHFLSINCLH